MVCHFSSLTSRWWSYVISQNIGFLMAKQQRGILKTRVSRVVTSFTSLSLQLLLPLLTSYLFLLSLPNIHLPQWRNKRPRKVSWLKIKEPSTEALLFGACGLSKNEAQTICVTFTTGMRLTLLCSQQLASWKPLEAKRNPRRQGYQDICSQTCCAQPFHDHVRSSTLIQ